MSLSALYSVQSSIRVLFSAGSQSERQLPPEIFNDELDFSTLDGEFPALRTNIWNSICEAVDSARIPSKYAQRVSDEAAYALHLLSHLVEKSKGVDKYGTGLIASCIWPLASLIAKVAIAGDASITLSNDFEGATDESMELPQVLEDDDQESNGWDLLHVSQLVHKSIPPETHTMDLESLSSEANEVSAVGIKSRYSGGLARLSSRPANIIDLAQAALRLCTALMSAEHSSMLQKIRGWTLANLSTDTAPLCPVITLATASVRALTTCLKQQPSIKRFTALLLTSGKCRVTGGMIKTSILSYLCQVRCFTRGELEVLSRTIVSIPSSIAPLSNAPYVEQITLLSTLSESLLDLSILPEESLHNLPSASLNGSTLLQEAAYLYNREQYPDDYALDKLTAGSESTDKRKKSAEKKGKQNKQGKKVGFADVSDEPDSIDSKTSNTVVSFHRSTLVPAEYKIFQSIHQVLQEGAATEVQVSVLNTLPHILIRYLKKLTQSSEAEDATNSVEVGEKAQPEGRKRERDASGSGAAVPPAFMDFAATISRNPSLAVAAEFIALATGYSTVSSPKDDSAPGSRVQFDLFDPNVPKLIPSVAANTDVLALRVRAVTAIVLALSEMRIWNEHFDSKPHMQASLLSYLSRWLFSILGQEDQLVSLFQSILNSNNAETKQQAAASFSALASSLTGLMAALLETGYYSLKNVPLEALALAAKPFQVRPDAAGKIDGVLVLTCWIARFGAWHGLLHSEATESQKAFFADLQKHFGTVASETYLQCLQVYSRLRQAGAWVNVLASVLSQTRVSSIPIVQVTADGPRVGPSVGVLDLANFLIAHYADDSDSTGLRLEVAGVMEDASVESHCPITSLVFPPIPGARNDVDHVALFLNQQLTSSEILTSWGTVIRHIPTGQLPGVLQQLANLLELLTLKTSQYTFQLCQTALNSSDDGSQPSTPATSSKTPSSSSKRRAKVPSFPDTAVAHVSGTNAQNLSQEALFQIVSSCALTTHALTSVLTETLRQLIPTLQSAVRYVNLLLRTSYSNSVVQHSAATAMYAQFVEKPSSASSDASAVIALLWGSAHTLQAAALDLLIACVPFASVHNNFPNARFFSLEAPVSSSESDKDSDVAQKESSKESPLDFVWPLNKYRLGKNNLVATAFSVQPYLTQLRLTKKCALLTIDYLVYPESVIKDKMQDDDVMQKVQASGLAALMKASYSHSAVVNSSQSIPKESAGFRLDRLNYSETEHETKESTTNTVATTLASHLKVYECLTSLSTSGASTSLVPAVHFDPLLWAKEAFLVFSKGKLRLLYSYVGMLKASSSPSDKVLRGTEKALNALSNHILKTPELASSVLDIVSHYADTESLKAYANELLHPSHYTKSQQAVFVELDASAGEQIGSIAAPQFETPKKKMKSKKQETPKSGQTASEPTSSTETVAPTQIVRWREDVLHTGKLYDQYSWRQHIATACTSHIRTSFLSLLKLFLDKEAEDSRNAALEASPEPSTPAPMDIDSASSLESSNYSSFVANRPLLNATLRFLQQEQLSADIELFTLLQKGMDVVQNALTLPQTPSSSKKSSKRKSERTDKETPVSSSSSLHITTPTTSSKDRATTPTSTRLKTPLSELKNASDFITLTSQRSISELVKVLADIHTSFSLLASFPGVVVAECTHESYELWNLLQIVHMVISNSNMFMNNLPYLTEIQTYTLELMNTCASYVDVLGSVTGYQNTYANTTAFLKWLALSSFDAMSIDAAFVAHRSLLETLSVQVLFTSVKSAVAGQLPPETNGEDESSKDSDSGDKDKKKEKKKKDKKKHSQELDESALRKAVRSAVAETVSSALADFGLPTSDTPDAVRTRKILETAPVLSSIASVHASFNSHDSSIAKAITKGISKAASGWLDSFASDTLLQFSQPAAPDSALALPIFSFLLSRLECEIAFFDVPEGTVDLHDKEAYPATARTLKMFAKCMQTYDAELISSKSLQFLLIRAMARILSTHKLNQNVVIALSDAFLNSPYIHNLLTQHLQQAHVCTRQLPPVVGLEAHSQGVSKVLILDSSSDETSAKAKADLYSWQTIAIDSYTNAFPTLLSAAEYLACHITPSSLPSLLNALSQNVQFLSNASNVHSPASVVDALKACEGHFRVSARLISAAANRFDAFLFNNSKASEESFSKSKDSKKSKKSKDKPSKSASYSENFLFNQRAQVNVYASVVVQNAVSTIGSIFSNPSLSNLSTALLGPVLESAWGLLTSVVTLPRYVTLSDASLGSIAQTLVHLQTISNAARESLRLAFSAESKYHKSAALALFEGSAAKTVSSSASNSAQLSISNFIAPYIDYLHPIDSMRIDLGCKPLTGFEHSSLSSRAYHTPMDASATFMAATCISLLQHAKALNQAGHSVQSSANGSNSVRSGISQQSTIRSVLPGSCVRAIAWLVAGLCRHRTEYAMNVLPTLVSSLDALVQIALTPSHDLTTHVDDLRDEKGMVVSSVLAFLARSVEAICRLLKPVRYQATRLLISLVMLASSPMLPVDSLRKASGFTVQFTQDQHSRLATLLAMKVQAGLPAPLFPGVVALFNVCTSKELQQIHTAMASKPRARAFLRSLHNEYLAEGKFGGKS